MSNGKGDSGTKRVDRGASASQPRAMIHKKILDVAGDNPEASLEAIANDVSGASVTFVEQVLDEYGDPASHAVAASQTDGTGYSDPPGADQNGQQPSSPVSGATDGQESETGGQDPPVEEESTQTDGQDTEVEDAADDAGSVETEAESDETSASEPSESTDEGTEADPVTAPAQLTQKQRETLRAVAADPTATQEAVADALGVTRATVSRRLGEVDGFDWQARAEFVDRVFDDAAVDSETDGEESRETSVSGEGHSDGSEADAAPDTAADQAAVADLQAQVDAIEARLTDEDETAESADADKASFDPELVQKVVHACMDAEYVSRDEELEVLGMFLGDGPRR